jgi:urease accessory protein
MAFVTTMLAGFAVASLGLPMPLVEAAISSSIVILGLFVALAIRAPLYLGAAIAGLFAFFHGHAHGGEATAASLIPYWRVYTFQPATDRYRPAGPYLGRCLAS